MSVGNENFDYHLPCSPTIPAVLSHPPNNFLHFGTPSSSQSYNELFGTSISVKARLLLKNSVQLVNKRLAVVS